MSDDKTLTQEDIDAAAAAVKARYSKKIEALEEKNTELKKALEDFTSRFEQLEDQDKTEAEKLKKLNEKLEAQLAEKEKAFQAESERVTAIERNSKIEKLFGKVKLVNGVDADLIRDAFAGKLSGISNEDLADEKATAGIVSEFIAKNKALILDESGGGLGGNKQGGGSVGQFRDVELPKSFKGMKHDDAIKTLDKAWDAVATKQEA